MIHYSLKRIAVGLFVILLLLTVPASAVTNYKVSTYGAGHQIWFEAEDFDERNPAGDQNFPVVDQAGAFGQAIGRAGSGGMIRWTFDISKARGRGGTWYFWVRTINPGNTSDYMLIEGDPGDTQIPSSAPFPSGDGAAPFTNDDDRILEETLGPPWGWSRSDHGEGHTKELRDGLNTMYVFDRQGDSSVFWDVFMWTDDPDYVPTDADYENAAPPSLGKASEPIPEDLAVDVPRDIVLSWTPGEYAPAVNGHRVILGTTFGDVNEGIGSVTQSASSYTPPQRLDFETTYYWRVNEVNAPPDSTVFQGDIWSFTTEPVGYPISGSNITATASSVGQADFGPEKTINGSGLDADDQHSTNASDMWLSGNEPQGAWIQYEFDKPYKLYEMWVWNANQSFEGLFGFGMKDVTVEYSIDGTDWTTLAGVSPFTQAPGVPGYAHNTTVDFGSVAAKFVRLTAANNWGGILPQYGLSEVRFFYIPVIARGPSPDSGATDVDLDAILTWRAGREAATHDLYLSTDEQAVIDGTAPVVTITDARYSPSALELGTTYYWRIDEANEAETPAIWQGGTWSFSTPGYLVVDDFEDYNDYPPDEIYSTWLDGYEIPANGSQVGYLTPPLVETTVIHGGKQSMPLFYSNTGGATYSEATRTFAPPQDWSRYGIQSLGVYFHGAPGNTGQLYVQVNSVKLAYPGDALDLTRPGWKRWIIDLASLGVNPKNITTLAIGIDGNGAAGTLYVDDIRLYPALSEQASVEIWIEAEAADSITQPMEIYPAGGVDPVTAAGGEGEPSGGFYIGTVSGVPGNNDNPGTQDIATYTFTVPVAGTYAIWGRVSNVADDSLWVHIPDAQYDVTVHSSGWIRWNSIEPETPDWHWVRVHSDDAGGEVVSVTLTAGQHTILWAHRESQNFLDAFVITGNLD